MSTLLARDHLPEIFWIRLRHSGVGSSRPLMWSDVPIQFDNTEHIIGQEAPIGGLPHGRQHPDENDAAGRGRGSKPPKT